MLQVMERQLEIFQVSKSPEAGPECGNLHYQLVQHYVEGDGGVCDFLAILEHLQEGFDVLLGSQYHYRLLCCQEYLPRAVIIISPFDIVASLPTQLLDSA